MDNSKPMQNILAPISLGELIDKITILEIKTQHLKGTGLENAKTELIALKRILKKLQLNIDPKLIEQLKKVNQDLWKTEDDIRAQERQKSFGASFIDLFVCTCGLIPQRVFTLSGLWRFYLVDKMP